MTNIGLNVQRGHIEAESTAARSRLYQDSVAKYVAEKRQLLLDGPQRENAEREGIEARMLEERKRKIEQGDR